MDQTTTAREDLATKATPNQDSIAAFTKEWRHDLIQTSTKLGLGAFGWQLGFMLSEHLFHESYDPELRVFTLHKVMTWLMTGAFASLVLSIGLCASQYLLEKLDQGKHHPLSESFSFRLNASVLVADALWQPLTDIGYVAFLALNNVIGNTIAAGILTAIFVYFPLYIIESFIFKLLYQGCDSEFIGVLAASYASFNLMVWAFMELTQLEFHRFSISTLFSCMIAMIGTIILPTLVLIGNHQIKKERLATILDLSRDSSITQTVVNDSIIQSDLEQPLVFSREEKEEDEDSRHFNCSNTVLFPLRVFNKAMEYVDKKCQWSPAPTPQEQDRATESFATPRNHRG